MEALAREKSASRRDRGWAGENVARSKGQAIGRSLAEEVEIKIWSSMTCLFFLTVDS